MNEINIINKSNIIYGNKYIIFIINIYIINKKILFFNLVRKNNKLINNCCPYLF